MVARLTVGKAGFEDLEGRMQAMVDTADAARAEFLALADRDAHAFDSVMDAFKMPKETEEEQDRPLGRDPGRLPRARPRCPRRWRADRWT